MHIHDVIYGDFVIVEPVLVELLSDPTVLRAGKIMQGSTTATINGLTDFSRLEHCIGTMLIVRSVGGDTEAQIAALLHDVSHTAFSHVVDFVYSKGDTQDHHEDIKESILLNSKIPGILNKYNFSLERIMNDAYFPLHELPSPDLCADRIDYGLRSFYHYFAKGKEAYSYFKALIVYENQIIFNNRKDASGFALDFYRLDTELLSNCRNLAAYYVFAEGIRQAINKNIIVEDDLLLTDDVVLEKLNNSRDEGVRKIMLSLTPEFRIMEDPQNYDISFKGKARWVNPKFVEDGTVKKVFDTDKDIELKVNNHRERMKNEFKVKIL